MRLLRATLHFLTVAGTAILLVSPPANAGPKASPEELELLPEWCRNFFPPIGPPNFYALYTGHIESLNVIEKPTLMRLHTSGCKGYHHYCWALTWANRFFFDLERTRDGGELKGNDFLLRTAIGDFGYVFGQSKNSCVLIPDMHVKSGEYYSLRGQHTEAEASYQKALKVRPGYAPAFVGLSDLYEMHGDTEKAVAVLKAGRKANPQSTVLKLKLDRLESRVSDEADRLNTPFEDTSD